MITTLTQTLWNGDSWSQTPGGGHHPASISDLRPHGRRRGMSMILLTRPCGRTGGRWVVSLVREVDFVSKTVLRNSFERHDAPEAAAFARRLSARFPSAYVAGF